jgi:hypothetical protein
MQADRAARLAAVISGAAADKPAKVVAGVEDKKP